MIKKLEVTNPQSCLNRAKDHEKIFVLLERDEATPVAIRAWVKARLELKKNKLEDPQITEALLCAEQMEEAYTCHHCGWHGPYIRASEHPDEPPCCPICG